MGRTGGEVNIRRLWKSIGLCVTLFLAVTVWAAPITWLTEYDAARLKAKNEKKLVLLYLYADWSGWCKKLEKEVLTDSQIQALVAKHFVPVKIRGEKDKKGEQLVIQFGAKTYPYLAFLDANGNSLAVLAGPTDVEAFMTEMQTALEQAAK